MRDDKSTLERPIVVAVAVVVPCVCVLCCCVFFSFIFLSCSLCFSFVCRAVLCHVVWLFVSTTRLDSLQYTIFDVVRGGKTKWPHSLNNKCINFLFIIVTKPISLHFISKFSFYVFGFSFFSVARCRKSLRNPYSSWKLANGSRHDGKWHAVSCQGNESFPWVRNLSLSLW